MTTKEAIITILEGHDKKVLNKARLARVLNITPQGIHAYIIGKSNASLVVKDKIKALFNLDITDCTYFNRPLTEEELLKAKI